MSVDTDLQNVMNGYHYIIVQLSYPDINDNLSLKVVWSMTQIILYSSTYQINVKWPKKIRSRSSKTCTRLITQW